MTCGTPSLFLMDNHADYAIVEADSELPTAPAANVQDPARANIWRSAIANSARLTFELLADTVAVTHVAVIDANTTKDGTLRVQAWSDAIDGSSPTFDQTVAPNVYIDPLKPDSYAGVGLAGVGPVGSPGAVLNQRNVTLIDVGALNSKYWAITFSDLNTSWQSCGRVFIADAVTFEANPHPAFGWAGDRIENSVTRKSIGGQRYVQQRDSQLHLRGSFINLKDSERTDMLVRAARFGETTPVVFAIFPERTDRGLTTTLYGTLKSPSVSHAAYNRNEFPFDLVEDL